MCVIICLNRPEHTAILKAKGLYLSAHTTGPVNADMDIVVRDNKKLRATNKELRATIKKLREELAEREHELGLAYLDVEDEQAAKMKAQKELAQVRDKVRAEEHANARELVTRAMGEKRQAEVKLNTERAKNRKLKMHFGSFESSFADQFLDI